MKIASDWGAVGLLLYVDPDDLTFEVKDEVKVMPYASAGENTGMSITIHIVIFH